MHETLCFSRQSASPNVDDLPLRCDGCETVSCVVGSFSDHSRIILGSVSDRFRIVNGVSTVFARSSIVFCNSVSADRLVMASSRLLRAVAACVIPLSFPAGSRKSYWSGCMKAATVICQQIFSILAPVIFFSKTLLKSASKSSFFRSGVEIRFWSCNFRPSCAYFYCVLQLSLCRSHSNGCVKVASCHGCMRNTIVFCSWTS